MKVRKKVVGIFLAVVVLCLGVGYTALADVLLIDGSVNINTEDVSDAFDENIFFSTPAMTASTESGETGVVATLNIPTISTDKDTLTISVDTGTFTAVGQAVKATAKIENSSLTNDASIAVTATEVNSTAGTLVNTLTVGSFEVTIELSADTVAKNNGSANGTIDVTIKIKLVTLPTADETNSFKFTLTATAI